MTFSGMICARKLTVCHNPFRIATFAEANLSYVLSSGVLVLTTTFAKPNLSQRCVISGASGGRGRSLSQPPVWAPV